MVNLKFIAETLADAKCRSSWASNRTQEVVRRRLILFTDDDVRPYPGWLAAYWDAFARWLVGRYFGGPLESEFEVELEDRSVLEGAPWSVRGLSWGDEERGGSDLEFVSANWACPQDALDAVSGFDPTLGLVGGGATVRVGEESDLMDRLKTRSLSPPYLPSARIRHFVPASKTAREHAAARAYASGYQSVAGSQRRGEQVVVWGAPAAAWTDCARALAACLRTRLRGDRSYQSYSRYQRNLWRIKAHRDVAEAARCTGLS